MAYPMFSVGETVVCVDAADLPSCFTPLSAGSVYCIRAVVPLLGENANYNANIHKNANYGVRLWGVSNETAPNGLERAYAETRFEKQIAESKKMTVNKKIAA